MTRHSKISSPGFNPACLDTSRVWLADGGGRCPARGISADLSQPQVVAGSGIVHPVGLSDPKPSVFQIPEARSSFPQSSRRDGAGRRCGLGSATRAETVLRFTGIVGKGLARQPGSIDSALFAGRPRSGSRSNLGNRCWNSEVAACLRVLMPSTNSEQKGKNMTHASTDVLRRSLDQVDRERKRAKVLLFGLLATTFAFWIAMMFGKNDHTGLPFGLAAVMGSVFVAGMVAAKASHDNTRAILKAIELLSKDKQDG